MNGPHPEWSNGGHMTAASEARTDWIMAQYQLDRSIASISRELGISHSRVTQIIARQEHIIRQRRLHPSPVPAPEGEVPRG